VFTTRAVIIIGAGASADYGLPLGNGLWKRIIKDCEQLPEHLSQFVKNTSRRADSYFHHVREGDPKAFAFFSLMRDLHGNIDLGQAGALSQTVKQAHVQDNVDEFVRDHPSVKRYMQALTAGNLFQDLYERENGTSHWRLKPHLFDPVRSVFPTPGLVQKIENWIRQFVGLCRNHLQRVRGGNDLLPVTVISFNYDRLFETVLREFWAKSEKSYPDLGRCFEFIYPYGAFSELKQQITGAGPWLLEQSEQIAIMHDEPSPQQRMAHEALDLADQIFMVGFSLSDSNMEWLDFDANHGRKVMAQNYKSEDKRLERLLAVWPGRSDPGSMIQLIRNGFFNP
jgi:hypothetical protein